MKLTSFQRLALLTTAVTYLLILVGGLVRASGAGLGCPDWPRCFGSWIPPASAADLPAAFDPAQFNPTLMWTEYLNRLLGATVGLLILATLVSAWRRHRRTPRILGPTAAAFLLVGFEGWLGGVVVAEELSPWIVTVHLLVALVIVSLLVYATTYAFFARVAGRALARDRRALMGLTAGLIVVTLAQVTIGAQVRGGVDHALSEGVERSLALARVGSWDWWHRDTALVVLGVAGATLLILRRRHAHEVPLVRVGYLVCALVALQLLLGVTLAYVALVPAAQVAHLTMSSLLLGAETLLLLLARWLP
jgi:cytochrome c oxidase assembly protein subunit 15